MNKLIHKQQEFPLDHPNSHHLFIDSPSRPFVMTPAAIDMFGKDKILDTFTYLQQFARQNKGLDYLQVFEDRETGQRLWFIEDGNHGPITALLPSDY